MPRSNGAQINELATRVKINMHTLLSQVDTNVA
jgi:hypothetical protein